MSISELNTLKLKKIVHIKPQKWETGANQNHLNKKHIRKTANFFLGSFRIENFVYLESSIYDSTPKN